MENEKLLISNNPNALFGLMEGEFYGTVFEGKPVTLLVHVTEKEPMLAEREQLERIGLFLKLEPARYRCEWLSGNGITPTLLAMQPSHIVFWGRLPEQWPVDMVANQPAYVSGIACLLAPTLATMNSSNLHKKEVAAFLLTICGQ